MDLRVQRTRKNIINAFIELRSRKPLEKITVKELSEHAFINKATFYTHYRDIYDLAEQLENESIQSVIDAIPHPEALVTNPKQGIYELASALHSQNTLFDILFKPPRDTVLTKKLEQELRKKIYEIFPQYENDLEKDILISLLIQGSFHAFHTHTAADFETILNILGDINEYIIKRYM